MSYEWASLGDRERHREEIIRLRTVNAALLEACEKAASGIDSHDPLAVAHAYQMLIGAIAKAKGE